jgi:hypothetical protein
MQLDSRNMLHHDEFCADRAVQASAASLVTEQLSVTACLFAKDGNTSLAFGFCKNVYRRDYSSDRAA